MKPFLFISSLILSLSSCQKQESTDTSVPEAEPYPLEVCLVSGEKLGSMGEPEVIVHEGRQIQFCCDTCIPKFEEDPEKYLSQLEAE